MYKIVINQLLEIASSNNIKVGWNHELSKYTPPVSAPTDKCIVMNVNWYNQKEIPFQSAHEIAHIQNGDDECITFYHATFSSKEMIER